MKIRRSLRLTVYTLCTLATLYSAAWYVIADQLERGIARWAADRRADGWTVTYGAVKLEGYPFAWHAVIETPDLAQNRRNPHFHWSGPAIVLIWQPWNPKTIGFEANGLHTVAMMADRNRVVIPVHLTHGEGQLLFGPEGALQRLELLLDGATLAHQTDQALLVNRLRVVGDVTPVAEAAKPSKPHLIPWLRLEADIFGLTLPKTIRPPLGRTIGRLVVRGTVMGQIPPGRTSESLSVWQKDGGTVEIPHLELGWASLVMKAGGTMALDSSLQPVGALTGKVSGYNETLDALVTANMIKPGAAMIARFALNALSKTPSQGGRPEIEVPVTLQEGWLFLGPVKLIQIPKIQWR